jgi:uncharacterized protein YndB with AHSA1/START domain
MPEMSDLFDTEIEHAVFVRADAQRVYDALTTAEGLDGWFTSGAEVDPRPGGTICFRWVDWGPDNVTAEDSGPVLEARRPERFVFQWSPDDSSYTTTVRVDFESVDGGAIVRLHESGFRNTPSGKKACLDCASGWGEALTLLKFYVEHGLRY